MSTSVRWEAGSMFHWEEDFPPPLWRLPAPAAYYMICRHAIAALCSVQPQRTRLWLPTFFCSEVARFCASVAEIREYRDDCRWSEPDWKSLQPEPRDLVLAVNYFGVRSREPWRAWQARNACILVEDHTQDPFSTWALESNAPYAVCSLRKTLPVPDGAMLWSPQNRPLPPPPKEGHWLGSTLKAGAMMFKRRYLEGSVSAETKLRYREWQLEGERQLSQAPMSTMSPISEAVLARGVPKVWRDRRIENAHTLLDGLEGWDAAKPAFSSCPAGHAPFDLPYVFPSESVRDFYQQALQQQNIFCPVEWPADTSDRNATELSSCILSIPIDHRYSKIDMEKIATAALSIEAAQPVCGGRAR